MVAWYMRRRSVVAMAALVAALAIAGLPGPAGSRTTTATRDLQSASFTSVIIPADAPAREARGLSGDAPVDGLVPFAAPVEDERYLEAGEGPAAPVSRPRVHQPQAKAGEAWKEPRRVITGFASFYDNGTTAMRLPRGTIIRICGAGGCIERTVTDYGPSAKGGRLIDMDRPDFFKICGCASWSGTTEVTVSVY
jgi:hypothetical protein